MQNLFSTMNGRYLSSLLGILLLLVFTPIRAQESSAPPLQQPVREKAEPAPTAASTSSTTDNTSRNNATATADESGSRVINSAANDYVLTGADTLEMSVFHEPDLTTRSKISSDGTVQLPLIGDIKVTGMTVRDARESIRKRYDAKYLVNPQVYLNVVDYAQKKFTILGQVAKPGTYEIPGGTSLSLLEAVGIAGGFTRSADRGKVSIERTTSEGRQSIKINAKKLSGDGENGFAVQPGDVISVAESWF